MKSPRSIAIVATLMILFSPPLLACGGLRFSLSAPGSQPRSIQVSRSDELSSKPSRFRLSVGDESVDIFLDRGELWLRGNRRSNFVWLRFDGENLLREDKQIGTLRGDKLTINGEHYEFVSQDAPRSVEDAGPARKPEWKLSLTKKGTPLLASVGPLWDFCRDDDPKSVEESALRMRRLVALAFVYLTQPATAPSNSGVGRKATEQPR